MIVAFAACSTGGGGRTPLCSDVDDGIFVLLAQSVPSATQLPCVSEFPSGWTFGGSNISDGLARFWLDSDRAGIHAVEVALRPSCDTTDAIEQRPAPDEAATRVFVRPDSLSPSFAGVRFLRLRRRLHRLHVPLRERRLIDARDRGRRSALAAPPRHDRRPRAGGDGAHPLRRRRPSVRRVASAGCSPTIAGLSGTHLPCWLPGLRPGGGRPASAGPGAPDVAPVRRPVRSADVRRRRPHPRDPA